MLTFVAVSVENKNRVEHKLTNMTLESLIFLHILYEQSKYANLHK